MKISRFNLLKLAVIFFLSLIWKAVTALVLISVTTYLYFPVCLLCAEHFLMDAVYCFMKSGILCDLTTFSCEVCKQEFLCVGYC